MPPDNAPRRSAPEEALSPEEVKSRAAGGAALLLGRGVAFQGLGFLGNLVLARLLVPDDFGIVAVGLTIMNVGQLIATAGLGAAVIRREQPPTHSELRAIHGLQLAMTSTIAAIAAAIAIAVGGDALVTALMALALPLLAFRTPPMLLFQRRLEFGAQVNVEIVEVLTNLVVAIALAALGFGAWSLAVAAVAKVLVGTVVAIALSPVGLVMPSMRLAPLKPLLAFGWRFQATGISQLAQDSVLTAGIAAVGGLTALGLWTLAARILGIPRLLFEAMSRVGFPTFSRLMKGDSDRRMGELLERAVGTFAVAVALVMCPLVASSPALIPLLFGSDWTDVSLILPGAGFAMVIAGPLGLVTSAYLYARGDANTGLVGSNVNGVTRVATTLALLPTLGVSAIGIGWAVGVLAGTTYTVPRVRRASGARLVARVAGPLGSATIAALVGWLVADALGVTVLGAVASALSASGLYILVMLLLARTTLMDAMAMGRNVSGSAVRRARVTRRRAPAPVPSPGA
jgi:O-antigen/teichoic acid export membrane protein